MCCVYRTILQLVSAQLLPVPVHEFVYYFPDEAVLTDHCYWFGPWYWYY